MVAFAAVIDHPPDNSPDRRGHRTAARGKRGVAAGSRSDRVDRKICGIKRETKAGRYHD
jgi:hypothetical protein